MTRATFKNTYPVFIAVLILVGFCLNSTATASLKAAYKYQELKKLSKDLKKQETPEALETLVTKAETFLTTYPDYKRVDEVYYLLGNARMALGQVEAAIQVFETSMEKHPEARYAERCLLNLGLAHDKLGNHDAADAVYQRLIDHPKFGTRSQAKLAKKILEQEHDSRTGEIPTPGSRARSAWVGKPATDFQGVTLNGEPLSLEKYRGQVVLLDFWATWCPPCIAEVPNLKRTYDAYKDQGFQIIGISLDRSLAPLEEYVEKQKLDWVHYWDQNGQVSTTYQVQAIPATFLIDRTGIIQKANLRGHALEHAVADLVKQKPVPPTPTPATPETEQEKPAPETEETEEEKASKPGAEEIIQRTVEAHGGLEKLQAVKNMVMESESVEHLPDGTLQDEGIAKTYVDTRRLRSDSWTFDRQLSSLIFDGDSVFVVGLAGAKPAPPAYVAFFRDSLFREPIWLLTRLATGEVSADSIGTEKVDGIPTHVLQVTQPSGKPFKIFISQETHRIVQFRYDVEIGAGAQNTVTRFADYREVDGIQIPYYRTTQNEEYRRVFINSIALNAALDESIFHPEQ